MPPTAVTLNSGAGSPTSSLVVISLSPKLSRLMALRNPLNNPFSGDRRGNKAALKKIAASRRFPIDHFAGTKYSRQPAQHQVFVQFLPGDTASAGDRFLDWSRPFQPDLRSFRCGHPIVEGFWVGNLFDQRRSCRTQPPEPHRPFL